MIQKIPDILAERRAQVKPVFSFELFPPKTDKGRRNMFKAVESLLEMNPDYISVTYGAGGSTSRATLEIIKELQNRYEITTLHHFTLVGQKRDVLAEIIGQIRDTGCRNILALRGDPPTEMGPKFRKVDGGIEYCYELIDLIREICGDEISIGVAGFPEKHIDCPDKETDSKYLKIKMDHGGEFAIAQLFFDNTVYTEYLDRTAKIGVWNSLIPGVLPITNYKKLLGFCETCGANVSQEVHNTFGPIKDDPEATVVKGIEWATNQCRDLLRRGAPGIHFYCLNKAEPVKTIWRNLLDIAP